jgi:hypothetical protein
MKTQTTHRLSSTQIIIYADQRKKPKILEDHIVPAWSGCVDSVQAGITYKCGECAKYGSDSFCHRKLRGGEEIADGILCCIIGHTEKSLDYWISYLEQNGSISPKAAAQVKEALSQRRTDKLAAAIVGRCKG